MKTAFLIAGLTIACVSASAQGKVTFGNDSNHLFVFGKRANLSSASGVDFSAYANLPIPQLGTPNQQMQLFTAQLWAGTISTSLTLATSVAAGQAGLADGRLANITVTLTGIPAYAPAFFQVRFFETAGQNYVLATSGGYLAAESPIFQVTPGNITPNSIVLPGAPGNSNWANGLIYVPNVLIPEPSTTGLAGLAIVALMFFRNRNGSNWPKRFIQLS